MAGTIDTYFEAWNATADAERRALIEQCLTSDVELIDENGRESGHNRTRGSYGSVPSRDPRWPNRKDERLRRVLGNHALFLGRS